MFFPPQTTVSQDLMPHIMFEVLGVPLFVYLYVRQTDGQADRQANQIHTHFSTALEHVKNAIVANKHNSFFHI